MKNNYDLIAPFYDQLVSLVFGKAVYKAQIELFDHLPEHGNLLFIGGGSGKVLKTLIQQRPLLKITYLEQSKKMLVLSQKKVPKTHKNVDFIQGDLSQLPEKKFDAALTFFFLDIFKQDERMSLFNHINQQLKPHGLWLVADFLPAAKLKHQIIEKMMYTFLCLSTNIASKSIPELKKHFTKQHFRLIKENLFYNGFIFSACYQKLGNDS